jgi:hypothetical protein
MVEWKKQDHFTEANHERLNRVSREDCNTSTPYEGTGKRGEKSIIGKGGAPPVK